MRPTRPTELTGSQYLAQAVAAAGIGHVFMVPTIAVPALAEMDRLGIVGVTAHSEGAAGYMADGYARARRGPGLCMAQAVGAMNLAAGLRDAHMASSPVIALTGGKDPMSAGRRVYQEVDDFSVFDAVCKANVRLDDVRRLPGTWRELMRAATSGRPGPVHAEIQGFVGDLLQQSFTPAEDDLLDLPSAGGRAPRPAVATRLPRHRPLPDPAVVREALRMIEAAQRPVLVAGAGVRLSGCESRLAEVAQRLRLPVATSLRAKGAYDEKAELAVGVLGASSRSSANLTVARADLVVFIGSGTGSQVTGAWRLPERSVQVIQVDIDPANLGMNYPRCLAIQADADAFLDAILQAATGSPDREEWLNEAMGYVANWRRDANERTSTNAIPIRPDQLCTEISDFLPDDGVLVADTGHSGIWVGGVVDCRAQQVVLPTAGTLGWALPASVGAQAAVGPGRTVLCFTGDGGFYYHLAELETAARHGLAPIVVVNNNGCLSQDMDPFQRAWGGADRITPAGDRMWRFGNADLTHAAADLGAFALTVTDPKDIRDALYEAQRSGRPAVVNVLTDPEVLPDPPAGGVNAYYAVA